MRDVLGVYPAPQVGADGQDVYVVPNQFVKPSSADMSTFLQSLRSRAVQDSPSGTPAPSTILAANGLSLGVGGGGVPPDTNGDVSPTHFIQWINTSWAIFDKTTGARLSGRRRVTRSSPALAASARPRTRAIRSRSGMTAPSAGS